MTAKDVIKLGESIDQINPYLHMLPLTVMLVLLSWMVILLATLTVIRKLQPADQETWLTRTVGFFGLILCAASAGAIGMNYMDTENTYVDKTNDWKTEAAYPYIKSQEYVDLELTSIEKDPYAAKHQPDEIIKYRNAEQIVEQLNSPERTQYDDTDGEKAYQLIYDVPADEKPFVRFYMLDKDLGHGVEPGPYGLDIHLNEKP